MRRSQTAHRPKRVPTGGQGRREARKSILNAVLGLGGEGERRKPAFFLNSSLEADRLLIQFLDFKKLEVGRGGEGMLFLHF